MRRGNPQSITHMFPSQLSFLGMQKENACHFCSQSLEPDALYFGSLVQGQSCIPSIHSEFRRLESQIPKFGIEIPKLWIPKTAQDCCENVNGTLDWGIPKILIASWIPKIEQFQKPLLPNKCLLIDSFPPLCMLIAPVSVKACEISLQSQSPTFRCSTEYSFHNGSQKTQS